VVDSSLSHLDKEQTVNIVEMVKEIHRTATPYEIEKRNNSNNG